MFTKNTYRLRTVYHTLVVVFSLVALLSLTFVSLYARTASAAPSTNLNFQARLKNGSGGVVPDGNYNIEFKIYDVSSGGTALWTETRTGGNVVRVANGYMTVNLGSVTPFPGTIQWGEQHWITMNIGGTGSPVWDGEMNPRLQLTAVPFAFKADSANNVASANQTGASTNSSNVSIQSGNAAGVTSNSGNISIDSGTATGTTGTISLGAANASSLILGRTGFTTLNNGSLTVAQNLVVDTDTLSVDATNNSVGIGLAAPGTTRLVVTNGVSTNQIFSLRDNTSEVLGVADGGAVSFKNETDSSAAFVIQRAASGGTLLTVNSSDVAGSRNGVLTVGQVDTAATLFVLDTKTDAGDPSGIDGAMYYNSNLGKFRCFENSAWTDCIASENSGFLVQVPSSSAINTITPTDNNVVALTVNGTSGTSVDALVVSQAGTARGGLIDLTNTSGTQNAGFSIIRSAVGGTTTNLLSVAQTGGTATNGILFSGTIGTDITTSSARSLNIITDTTGAVTLDSGTTGAINLGTNTGAKTINIGTGATGAKVINIGGTASNTIDVGDAQTAGSVNIGGALTTGTIRIGGTGAQTGTISLGTGTGAQIINLGTGTGAKTINIGTGQTAGSISLGTAMTTGTITIGGTGLQTGTINLGIGTGAQDINIGTGGTGSKNVTIGSSANTGATLIQSGTGNVSFQAAGNSTVGIIQVGDGGAGSTTPDLLGLDVKSTTGDPAGGAEGMMYYNTFDNKFRCYEGGAWTNCITPPGSGIALVQDEGTGLTLRPTINFTGSGVTCTDNAGQNRTDCTVGSGGTGVTLLLSDGAGATSSDSGLEFDGADVGLLQGCSDGQTLKWDDTAAVWECGSDRATYQDVMTGNYTNNSITFTDVNDDATGTTGLVFPVGANETWIFEMRASVQSPTAADSQYRVNAPVGSTCDVTYNNFEQAVSISNMACGAGTGNQGTNNTPDEMEFSGVVQTGVTAGVVQLQFRQNAASGTSTIFAGSYVVAYKVSGADVGEAYYTSDNDMKPGTLVSIDPMYEAGVRRSSGLDDNLLLGVISTKPGVVLGDTKPAGTPGRPVFIGLTGRVPVRVTAENGAIAPGDYITSSSIQGVGMKSTGNSRVVGRALSSFSGEGEGLVMMYVDNDSSALSAVSPVELDESGNIVTTLTSGTRAVWDNSAGEVVAWVSDTGEAVFTKVTATVGSFKQLVFGEIAVEKDSGTAGEATIESDMIELVIESDKVKEDSLISLTLSSPSGNRQLFVKEKVAGESFTVSFESLGLVDSEPVTFNWLIINQQVSSN